MTREAFIEELERNRYSYEVVGDKIVVTHDGYVSLGSLQTIPPGVEFRNGAAINLGSLETLPPGVKFENRGNIWLESLKTIPPGVKFENRGSVHLDSLIGNWFFVWEGNIEGIDSKRLLNVMIKQGVFI